MTQKKKKHMAGFLEEFTEFGYFENLVERRHAYSNC